MLCCIPCFNLLFTLINIIFDYFIIEKSILSKLFNYYIKNKNNNSDEFSSDCNIVNIYIFVNICITLVIPIFMLIKIILFRNNIKLILYKILLFIFILINVWSIINLTKLNCINGTINLFIFYYIIVQSFIILNILFFYIIWVIFISN